MINNITVYCIKDQMKNKTTGEPSIALHKDYSEISMLTI